MASPSSFPSPHIIFPTAPHTHTIILLHGRGSNGPEFATELFEAQSSNALSFITLLPGWKWIFPTSQERYSSVFQEKMDEWFDIYSLTDPSQKEELQVEGLRDSVQFICKLVEDEAELVPADRLVLGGISQGCATSLLALLAGRRVGAFIGWCGWLPFQSHIATMKDGSKPEEDLQAQLALFFHSTLNIKTQTSKKENIGSALATPVFLGHSVDDDVVEITLGREMSKVLGGLGMKVDWKEYGFGGHWVAEPDGVDDVVKFLKRTEG